MIEEDGMSLQLCVESSAAMPKCTVLQVLQVRTACDSEARR
jgi:hypothetical protein